MRLSRPEADHQFEERPSAPELVDLSQNYFSGMPAPSIYEQPTFEVSAVTTAVGAEISVTNLSMSAHVGTHIDAARHFFKDGRTIDQYPVSLFRGPGLVVEVIREGIVPVTADEILETGVKIHRGDIVLLRFGYGERFCSPLYLLHPYLSVDAAQMLVDLGVRMVGVDVMTPDCPEPARSADFDWPIHRRLLGADIPIIENLGPNLCKVIGKRLDIIAMPLTIRGGDGAPARVVAAVDSTYEHQSRRGGRV